MIVLALALTWVKAFKAPTGASPFKNKGQIKNPDLLGCNPEILMLMLAQQRRPKDSPRPSLAHRSRRNAVFPDYISGDNAAQKRVKRMFAAQHKLLPVNDSGTVAWR